MIKLWKFSNWQEKNTEEILGLICIEKAKPKCSLVFGQNRIKEIQLTMFLKRCPVTSIRQMLNLDTVFSTISLFFHPCVPIQLVQKRKFTTHLIIRTCIRRKFRKVFMAKKN